MVAFVVVLNTTAQTLLKLGAGRGLINLPLFGGVAAYGLSTILYVFILGRANLSLAYPIVIGLTSIFTCLSGRQVFGERIGNPQWIGIALIIGGIAFLAGSRNLKTSDEPAAAVTAD